MSTIYQGNIHKQKCWTQEMPTNKIFGPTKYAWEKILDLQQTHKKKFSTHEIHTRKNFGPTKTQWHHDTRPAMWHKIHGI